MKGELLHYPNISRDNWKSVKIKSLEYPKIFQLYYNGMTLYQIADLYNVCQETIKTIIDPVWYRKRLEKKYERDHKNWFSDKLWRQEKINRNKEWSEGRRKTEIKYRLWSNQVRRKSNVTNKITIRKRGQEYWQKNKEYGMARHREWIEKNKEHHKQYQKNYRDTHKVEKKEYMKNYHLKHRQKPPKAMPTP